VSIITKRGDDGQTDLLYGERIAKVSLRVETIGVIDELNATIGLARCHGSESLSTELDWVQAKLVGLMGELAVLPKDLERYSGFSLGERRGLGPLLSLLIESSSSPCRCRRFQESRSRDSPLTLRYLLRTSEPLSHLGPVTCRPRHAGQ